jgi:hypothetical protein
VKDFEDKHNHALGTRGSSFAMLLHNLFVAETKCACKKFYLFRLLYLVLICCQTLTFGAMSTANMFHIWCCQNSFPFYLLSNKTF